MIDDSWKKTGGLALCLFGHMEIWNRGEEITGSIPTIARQLLALLVLNHEAPQLRRNLSDKIWPDEFDEPYALRRNKFRQHLLKLRAGLGGEARRLQEPEGLGGEALQFDVKDIAVDVFQFRAALVYSVSDPRGRRMEEAAHFYRDNLLLDIPARWTDFPRDSLRRSYSKLAVRLSEEALQDGAGDRAEEWLRKAIAFDPLDEECIRLLIGLLARSGRTREMEDVYQNLLQAIENCEFYSRSAPNISTQNLFETLKSRSAKSLRDTPSTYRAPRGGYESFAGLPATPLPLIGHESLCTDLALSLRTSQLITLIGPGGIGKTRIAVEIARRSTSDFPDGVVFVDMAVCPRAADISVIVQRFAQALGASGVLDRNPKIGLSGILKDRRMLLVVDNCEHVIEAVSSVVDEVIRRQPSVRFLATSVVALTSAEQMVQRIPPLFHPKNPDAWTPEAIASSDAGRIFLNRIRNLGCVLTPAIASGIGWICRTVEGNPLGIEIAAATMNDFPDIADLVESIRQSLTRPQDSVGDARRRNRTLGAMLQWTYSLLETEEQGFLESLSILIGGGSLETVEAVSGSENALVFLRNLEARSLVVSQAPPGLTTDVTTHRFRMLEPVRRFVEARLAVSNQGARVARRHALWFAMLIEKTALKLQSADQTDSLNSLDAERGNFHRALDWCLRDSAGVEDLEPGFRILGRLWQLWMIRGGQVTGKEIINRAYPRRLAVSPAVRMQFLRGAGNLALGRADVDLAVDCFRELMAIAQLEGDRVTEAGTLGSLATAARIKGDHENARRLLLNCLGIFRDLGESQSVAFCLGNLANIASDVRDFTEAARLHEEAILILRQLNSPHDLILALNNLAHTLLQIDELTRFPGVIREVYLLSQRTGNIRGTVHGLSLTISFLSKYERAMEITALLGIHDTLRQQNQLPLTPEKHVEYQRLQAGIRNELGDRAFDDQYKIGSQFSERAASLYILGCLGD